MAITIKTCSSLSSYLFGLRYNYFYLSQSSIRCFHASKCLGAGEIWRKKHKLPEFIMNYGPLRDLPDWSFKDGTPPPLLKKEKIKLEHRKQLAYDIVKMLKEIKLAENFHKDQELEKAMSHKEALQNKLKAKGANLLSENNQNLVDELSNEYKAVEIDRASNVLEFPSDPTTGEFDPNVSISMPPLTEDMTDNVNDPVKND